MGFLDSIFGGGGGDEDIRSEVTRTVNTVTGVLTQQVFDCAPRVSGSQLIDVANRNCDGNVYIRNNTLNQYLQLEAKCLRSLTVTPGAKAQMQAMLDDLADRLASDVMGVGKDDIPKYNAIVKITADLGVRITNTFRVKCATMVTSNQAVVVDRTDCGDSSNYTSVSYVGMDQFTTAMTTCIAQSSVVTQAVTALSALQDSSPAAARRVLTGLSVATAFALLTAVGLWWLWRRWAANKGG